MNFTKFPKATHYNQALQEGIVPETSFTITEKLDGANAGIVYTDKGLLVHSRNTPLAFLSSYEGVIPDRIENDFRGLVDWVSQRRDKIYAGLARDDMPDHMFGEWLVPHTLTYPNEMWNQFYAFDLALGTACGVPTVSTIQTVVRQPTLDYIEDLMARYIELVDRPVEGLVIAPAGDDPYRDRFKYVRPEFKEEAGKKWAVKAALREGPIEDQLVVAYPVRAYQKIVEKVHDLKGKATRKETGAVLNMAWNDYISEFFGKALKDARYPVVDTNALRSTFFDRIREMYLTELDTGNLPMWAINSVSRAADERIN